MKAKKKFFLIITILATFVMGYYFVASSFNTSEKNLENEFPELVLS